MPTGFPPKETGRDFPEINCYWELVIAGFAGRAKPNLLPKQSSLKSPTGEVIPCHTQTFRFDSMNVARKRRDLAAAPSLSAKRIAGYFLPAFLPVVGTVAMVCRMRLAIL